LKTPSEGGEKMRETFPFKNKEEKRGVYTQGGGRKESAC